MNKVIATAGLVTLSAGSVLAQIDIGSVAGQLTPLQTAKPWSVSAAVRGFYDDNYLTLPKGYLPNMQHGSWGSEITPAGTVNHVGENTLLSASYVYDLQWYDNGSNTLFQTHQFTGHAEHQFSDRYKLSVNDNFVDSQQPGVLTPESSGVYSSERVVSGSNIRNTGQVDFSAALTKLLDVHAGYGNSYYQYQQNANSIVGYPFTSASGFNGVPPASYQALLDRMEQLATLDLRWKISPETTGILGYQFGDTQYTSSEYIIYPYGTSGPEYPTPSGLPSTAPANGPGYRSDIRNSESQFGFAGIDQSITPTLNASLRLGAEYVDFYNYGTSRVAPYVDGSMTWQYLPGDSAQLGVKHIYNATDEAGFIGTTPVLAEESTAVYLSDSHKFTDRFTTTVMGQAQDSTFVGGGPGIDGQSEQFYILEINFAYHFNPWLMAEAGYNYSKLNSPLIDRAYTRDVMYLGLRAVY